MSEEEQKPLSADDIEVLRNFSVGEPPFNDVGNFEFSEATLKNWTSFPPETEIIFPLTRHDLDHLFFSYAQLGAAVATLQLTVKFLSRQEIAAAETTYGKSLEMRSMADANFRKFFDSIMAKAKPNV